MRTIKTGITSFGMSGQVFHGPCLKVHPGFEICKVLERTKSISAENYPEADIVRSYTDILSDPEIELIIVNSPDALHYEMCKQALNADKHVLVEKPFSLFTWQAEELIQLAKEKDKCLTVYHNRRLDGDFLTAQKLISDGVLGRMVEFESHYDRYRNFIQDSWKESKGERNGVLFNLGSHMIDQALVLFGEPLSVTAHLRTLRDGGQVADYYDIRLQYHQFSALLKCSYLVKEPGPRYMIHGTLGSFLKWGIDPQEDLLKQGHLPEGDAWGEEDELHWGQLYTDKNGTDIKQKIKTIAGNYGEFYNNLYLAITEGTTLLVKPEEALLTMKIIEICLKSNTENRTIFLNED